MTDKHRAGEDGEPGGRPPHQLTVAELLARLGQRPDTTPRRRRAVDDDEAIDEKAVDETANGRAGDDRSADDEIAPDEPARTSPDASDDGESEDRAPHEPELEGGTSEPPEPDRAAPSLDPSEDGERGRRSIYQRHSALRALLVVGVVVAIVAAYYVAVLFVARGQIARESVLRVNGAEVVNRPLQEGAQNYLITVSDSSSRDAKGAQITALAHLSANEKRVVIVSFPRTTVVDIPPCGTAKKPVAPFTGTIESAYAAGGARCSVAAMQATTGILINHYIGVDLGKFPEVVDALGGLDVCLKAPLKDPAQKLSLPAGTTTLDGKHAADYVRAVNQGSGDDPARATRQIDFLSRLFSAALSAQTLLNPVRATKFAFASAAALTIDDSTTLGQLRTLAGSLSDLGKHEKSGAAVIVVPPISSTTIPLPGSSAVGVRIDDNAGPAMFDAIINDEPLESTPAGGQDQQPADSTAKPDPNAGPGAVDDAQGSTWGSPSQSPPPGAAPVVETC